MLSKNKYVKGNSILEVLIALAIISFCLTMMTMIFLNIQKSSLSIIKLKANEIAVTALRETITNQSYMNDEFKREEFFVKKSITQHSTFRDCSVVRILVFDTKHKKITELHQVIRNGSSS